MNMPDALASQLRMVAEMLHSIARMVGDARFADVPGLHDGFAEAGYLIKGAPDMAAHMRTLANHIERPSPQARKMGTTDTP